MKELFNEIVTWHEETFPDVSIDEQVLKFKEEVIELETAKEFREKLDELADCFIAGFAYANKLGFNIDGIEAIVKQKLSYNKGRVFEKNENGVFKGSKDGVVDRSVFINCKTCRFLDKKPDEEPCKSCNRNNITV
jgi:hypothetical protein